MSGTLYILQRISDSAKSGEGGGVITNFIRISSLLAAALHICFPIFIRILFSIDTILRKFTWQFLPSRFLVVQIYKLNIPTYYPAYNSIYDSISRLCQFTSRGLERDMNKVFDVWLRDEP